MISLNLNPPQQKKEVRLRRCYYLLKNNFGLLSIVLVICAIVLLAAKNSLQLSFSDIVAESSLINQQIRGANQQIVAINDQLNDISRAQKQFIPWSNIIVDMVKNLPDNVQINFFIIQPATEDKTGSNYNLTLRGLAKTHDDYLAIKDKLTSTGLFNTVNAPINQLTSKEDIDFEIKAALDINKIKPQ